jgi:hypothetical protein
VGLQDAARLIEQLAGRADDQLERQLDVVPVRIDDGLDEEVVPVPRFFDVGDLEIGEALEPLRVADPRLVVGEVETGNEARSTDELEQIVARPGLPVLARIELACHPCSLPAATVRPRRASRRRDAGFSGFIDACRATSEQGASELPRRRAGARRAARPSGSSAPKRGRHWRSRR